MLDPIIEFFTKIFYWIGRGIGQVVAWLCWPFLAFAAWYRASGWILKTIVGVILLIVLFGYGRFWYQTQIWHNFNPDYVAAYEFDKRTTKPGEEVEGTNQCGSSAIVQVTADLADFNVNQNAWVSSTLVSKMGLFGVEWKNTPYFDNKAAFQKGINSAIRRTTFEMVDRLGRVRGTSQIDKDLQDARENFNYGEEVWYFSLSPFGPRSATPSLYRRGVENLRDFNGRLQRCEAVFDARADNIYEFLNSVANGIGSTSDILRDRIEASDAGWFDFRADDRFWFAYGQLYAYYGILSAANADFGEVYDKRNLDKLWNQTAGQLRSALDMQPLIISNGNESSFIMPTHLASMGFYILRVRSNLTEMRAVFDR